MSPTLTMAFSSGVFNWTGWHAVSFTLDFPTPVYTLQVRRT